MKKRQIWVLLLLVCGGLIVAYAGAKVVYNLQVPIYQVGTCLQLYMRDHNGQFPGSRADLEDGYLRIEEEAGELTHHLKCDFYEVVTRVPTKERIEGDWMRCPFSKFDIRYESARENIVLRNGLLYDRATGEGVLLFTGPHSIILRQTYEALSLRLFEELQ